MLEGDCQGPVLFGGGRRGVGFDAATVLMCSCDARLGLLAIQAQSIHLVCRADIGCFPCWGTFKYLETNSCVSWGATVTTNVHMCLGWWSYEILRSEFLCAKRSQNPHQASLSTIEWVKTFQIFCSKSITLGDWNFLEQNIFWRWITMSFWHNHFWQFMKHLYESNHNLWHFFVGSPFYEG